MIKTFKLKAGSTTPEQKKDDEPQTYAEAVARERAGWGDAWQSDADPVPTMCLQWKMACIDLLRPVMAGEAFHRRYLAARASMGQITKDQIRAKAETGDWIRDIILDWFPTGWDRRMRKAHFALLVAQGLIPNSTKPAVREWLSGQVYQPGRSPADLDQRMRDAEQAQAFGGAA
jgi:hypothetical protein